MNWYVQVIGVIVGVMLFLWSTAVISTAVAMGISEGRLRRNERYQLATAIAVLLACLIGYFLLQNHMLPSDE